MAQSQPPLEVAVVQTAPEFAVSQRNLERALTLAGSTAAQLVVLPELCSTGYQFESRDEALELAEPLPDGPSARLLADWARQQRRWLAAGLAERAGDKLYNSALLVGPEGPIGVYRKAHLFQREKLWAEPGDTGFRVWDLGPVKVGLLVCYDWRYPEAARSLALAGADLILHPSNLVLPWCQQTMLARSLENGIYTATANRVGREQRRGWEELRFTGRSQITSPDGERLAWLDAEDEAVATARIEPAVARNKQRGLNHLFDDRRTELYR